MLKNFFIVAWRNLVKNKVYSILNIAGLAIGVAVCLLIGVWLQRELSFDDYHSADNNVFRVVNTFKSESEGFSQAPSGIALGAQLPKQLPIIKSACRVFGLSYKFKYGSNQFFEPAVSVVDSNFFTFFNFRLLQGKPSLVLDASNKIVLSEKMAIKYFGNTNNAVGKTILMDGQPMIISGVAENPLPNSHLQCNIFVPYAYLKNFALQHFKENLDNEWVGGWPFTYIKIADPLKWKEAEQQVNAVVARFSAKSWKENKMSYQYFLQPVADIHLKSHLRYDAENNGSLATVSVFAIVGIIVLLLACINYINLTTASAVKRAKSTSVRKVVGATKTQLIQQFFAETLIVCAVAVILGIALLKLVLPPFSTFMGQPYYFALTVKNISIIVAAVVLVSAVAGIYPAAMLSSFNPAIALKGSFVQSKSGNVIRKGLVVFQFTITIALIASILIITRQMDFIKNTSLGFNSSAVLEVNFNGDSNVVAHYTAIRDELKKSPYVLNVAKHNENVVGGLGNGWTTTVNLQGKNVSTSIYQLGVDADYFDTYNMKLAAGRFFSKNFPSDSSKAVLVNEAAVRTFGWQTPANAIGKPFGDDDKRYVVGVVKDFNFESLHKPVDALLIGFVRRGGSSMSLKMDATHLDEAISHLAKTWKAIVPDAPLQYAFVDDSIARQYGSEQKMEGVFYGFACLSLLIACLGLFGLSIFVVESKVKEIGIRKVLGASVTGITGLLSKGFLKLVAIAFVIATPVAWYAMHEWLQNFAYRVTIGWWLFAIAGLLALFIALVTVSFRAVKAAIANPVKALKAE